MVDLKHSGLKKSQGPLGLSISELIERLGFSGIQTKDCAEFLIQKTKDNVNVCGENVLKSVWVNPKQINSALAEFIAGVFAGDGSFSVNLLTPIFSKIKKN